MFPPRPVERNPPQILELPQSHLPLSLNYFLKENCILL